MQKPSRIASATMIIGLSGSLLGALLKWNHYLGAEPVFNGGVGLIVLGLLMWAFQLLRKAKP